MRAHEYTPLVGQNKDTRRKRREKKKNRKSVESIIDLSTSKRGYDNVDNHLQIRSFKE